MERSGGSLANDGGAHGRAAPSLLGTRLCSSRGSVPVHSATLCAVHLTADAEGDARSARLMLELKAALKKRNALQSPQTEMKDTPSHDNSPPKSKQTPPCDSITMPCAAVTMPCNVHHQQASFRNGDVVATEARIKEPSQTTDPSLPFKDLDSGISYSLAEMDALTPTTHDLINSITIKDLDSGLSYSLAEMDALIHTPPSKECPSKVHTRPLATPPLGATQPKQTMDQLSGHQRVLQLTWPPPQWVPAVSPTKYVSSLPSKQRLQLTAPHSARSQPPLLACDPQRYSRAMPWGGQRLSRLAMEKSPKAALAHARAAEEKGMKKKSMETSLALSTRVHPIRPHLTLPNLTLPNSTTPTRADLETQTRALSPKKVFFLSLINATHMSDPIPPISRRHLSFVDASLTCLSNPNPNPNPNLTDRVRQRVRRRAHGTCSCPAAGALAPELDSAPSLPQLTMGYYRYRFDCDTSHYALGRECSMQCTLGRDCDVSSSVCIGGSSAVGVARMSMLGAEHVMRSDGGSKYGTEFRLGAVAIEPDCEDDDETEEDVDETESDESESNDETEERADAHCQSSDESQAADELRV